MGFAEIDKAGVKSTDTRRETGAIDRNMARKGTKMKLGA